MILIADSGSTKTDWRFIDTSGKISQLKTEGLNPYTCALEDIHQTLLLNIEPEVRQKTKKLFFYGAGCKGDVKDNMQNVLSSIFENCSQLVVENDLLAAARATCGHKAGIACILGTGANSCLYNGDKIVDHIPPLGYILGDEGSGAYLGKELVNAYFKRELPSDLHKRFKKRYNLNEQELLDKVYQQLFPNKFLASFTRFLHHHIKHEYIKHLLYNAFIAFFRKNILKYENYSKITVHFVGSIAFYFNDILRIAAGEVQVNLGLILEKPIAGLTLFHEKDINT